MADKPTKRFARTPENILVAMGFSLSRENKAKLKYWRTFTDFPKKTRNGFDIDDLKAFLKRHVDEFISDAKLVKSIEQGDKFSGGDMKLLRGSAGRTFKVEDQEFPEIASGMDDLGALIMARFKEYPALGEVGRQRIHAWKQLKGVQKRPGVVPFPNATARNDYKVTDAFDWVARWILPDLPRNQGDLIGDNVDWTTALKKIEFENKTIEQQQLKGRLMDKAEHNRILATLGNLARNTLWDLFDHTAYDRMQDILEQAAMPEEWRQFVMAELRKLNPELLVKFAAAVGAGIQENQRDAGPQIETAKPPSTP